MRCSLLYDFRKKKLFLSSQFELMIFGITSRALPCPTFETVCLITMTHPSVGLPLLCELRTVYGVETTERDFPQIFHKHLQATEC